jgi:hypothetical protein
LPERAEDGGAVETEGADRGETVGGDTAEGEDLWNADCGMRIAEWTGVEEGGEVGVRECGRGGGVAGFGERGKNRGKEERVAGGRIRGEDGAKFGEGVDGAGAEEAGRGGRGATRSIVARAGSPWYVMGRMPMPPGGGRDARAAMMEAADGVVGSEIVVGVEDEAGMVFGGDGVEVGDEAGARPRGLADVVTGEPGGKEHGERGEFARVVVFGGDDNEAEGRGRGVGHCMQGGRRSRVWRRFGISQ